MTQILFARYRFKEVFQEADSLAVDIPNVWEYLGEIVAGTIKDNYKMWQLLKTGCQELALNRRDVFFRKTLAVGAHKLVSNLCIFYSLKCIVI